MPTITNDHGRSHVFNLDIDQAGRGPYLVTQTGYAPGDLTLTEKVFILRRDGGWVDCLFFFMARDLGTLEIAVFDTMREVIGLFEQLSGEARVEPLPFTAEEMLAWEAGNPGVRPGLPGLRHFVEHYKQQHRNG